MEYNLHKFIYFRLGKLLRKFKFKEATEFCNTFGLDIETVHEAKAQYLCRMLDPWKSLSNNTTTADIISNTNRCFFFIFL